MYHAKQMPAYLTHSSVKCTAFNSNESIIKYLLCYKLAYIKEFSEYVAGL